MNQITPIQYLVTNYPTMINLGFTITILVLCIIFFKKTSNKSWIPFIISFILSSATHIIVLAIDYPNLAYKLDYVLGMPIAQIGLIMLFLSLTFLALNVVATLFLIWGLVKVYREHQERHQG